MRGLDRVEEEDREPDDREGEGRVLPDRDRVVGEGRREREPERRRPDEPRRRAVPPGAGEHRADEQRGRDHLRDGHRREGVERSPEQPEEPGVQERMPVLVAPVHELVPLDDGVVRHHAGIEGEPVEAPHEGRDRAVARPSPGPPERIARLRSAAEALGDEPPRDPEEHEGDDVAARRSPESTRLDVVGPDHHPVARRDGRRRRAPGPAGRRPAARTSVRARPPAQRDRHGGRRCGSDAVIACHRPASDQGMASGQYPARRRAARADPRSAPRSPAGRRDAAARGRCTDGDQTARRATHRRPCSEAAAPRRRPHGVEAEVVAQATRAGCGDARGGTPARSAT